MSVYIRCMCSTAVHIVFSIVVHALTMRQMLWSDVTFHCESQVVVNMCAAGKINSCWFNISKIKEMIFKPCK